MGALQTPTPLKTPTHIAIKNILFATDFTGASLNALPFAMAIARRYNATILVTHVLPPEPHRAVPMDSMPAEQDQAHRLAQQEMEKLETSGGLKGVLHESLIERGSLGEVLAEVLPARHIDLIVAGTHGREGVRKLILGSVAEEIFRTASCPVLTVGPHVTTDVLSDGKFHRVLFATDFSPGSRHALPYAISLAEEDHAKLTLLHAVHLDSTIIEGAPAVLTEEAMAAQSQKWLRELVPPDAALWAEPEILVRSGLTAEVIVATAEEEQASIVVMGVHHAGALSSHNPWAVAHHVVCHAHCPVLSVRG